MYTQATDRAEGGRHTDLTVRIPTDSTFGVLATEGPTGSGGSAQTESPSSSGSSLSQLDRKRATGQDQAAQQVVRLPWF